VELYGLETRGDWLHVKAAFEDGTALDGWAERAALEEVGGDGDRGIGTGLGLCRPGCRGLGAEEVEYRGPAVVRAGSSVLDEPSGTAWARVPRDVQVIVSVAAGAEWVQLLEVPGIAEDLGCSRFVHAYVERTSVRFATSSRKGAG
jgi:hypothetical protein